VDGLCASKNKNNQELPEEFIAAVCTEMGSADVCGVSAGTEWELGKGGEV
jgi:hypothetical protein